jgi:hypothetical protein
MDVDKDDSDGEDEHLKCLVNRLRPLQLPWYVFPSLSRMTESAPFNRRAPLPLHRPLPSSHLTKL